MADVRSLLKKEHSSRRITHPHASYTDSGKLLCTVCRTPIKTESLWSNHIKTPEHAARVQSLDKATTERLSKKRKADDDEDDEDEGRKRARPEDEGALEQMEDGLEQDDGETDEPHTPGEQPKTAVTARLDLAPTNVNVANSQPAVAAEDEEDEEWAALQREIAAADATSQNAASIPAQAIISAAPMSAEEIAAQAREEQSIQQRGRRDAEIEAEKEDAELTLQDEFEEMEELEQRVRKLREKREALRTTSQSNNVGVESTVAGPVEDVAAVEDEIKVDEDEEDLEEEDFDDFFAR